MSLDLSDGIYDEVINKGMISRLQSVEAGAIYKEKIDPVEAPAILSDYLSRIVENKLRSIQENKNKLEGQIDLINRMIKFIGETDENCVNDPGEQLKTLQQNNPLTQITKLEAKNYPRPTTSVAYTSLFTNASREPRLEAEFLKEIASCDRIDFMVSFIKYSGLIKLLDELRAFAESGKPIRIITTTYIGATDLKAIEKLNELPNTEIKISFDGTRTRLHSKVYIFHRNSGYSTAYVGSSNISKYALTTGDEWNVKVARKELPDVFDKIEAAYLERWNSKDYELYSSEKRNMLFEALGVANSKQKAKRVSGFYFDVSPYVYQQAILDKLEAERNIVGSYKNLICAATGTGKTIISAFDYRKQCQAKKRRLKLLFVAHRREILEQSIQCYREVLRDSEFGDVFYSGCEARQLDYLFASVDILNSRNFIDELPADYYDYIVLDECHHMAADSYKSLFDHFSPKYFVGLTATPERMDGQSILPYFNDRLAAEIRLPEAINRDLLCPFVYFGVYDETDLSGLKWSRKGYDKSELENVFVFSQAVANKRASLIVQSINKYINDVDLVRGIVFCVSKEHAKFMSNVFNEAGLKSVYLTGDSSDGERLLVKQKLRLGEINFVCVVDIYNEGVDIKEINTVLFLRPTESMTVFLQQLGRGLRLCEGKECLTVLDFVGQANKNFRFDSKYSALLNASNQGIKREIKDGFLHLPKGCFIKLEKKAKEIILKNIQNSINGKERINNSIKSYYVDCDKEFSLQVFCDEYSIIPRYIYKYKTTVTEALGYASGSYDNEMWKKLFRLSSLNSVEILSYLIENFDKLGDIDFAKLSSNEMDCWKCVYATFIDDKEPVCDYEMMNDLKTYWIINRCFVSETMDLLKYCMSSVDFLEEKVELPYESSLRAYSTYTRAQALALLDYWKTSSEGVTRVPEKQTTCLFITLNKSNHYYSPSTAYRDYSINDELFHWQSQNATAPNTKVGQRFIKHKEKKESILLFVREQKNDEYGPVPFVFLGKGNFVSYQGEKPMNIVWRLEKKIPARFLEVTSQLGII